MIIRHGSIVLDAAFEPFASGRLGEPFASGRLHELQSATKSVTSMVLGTVLSGRAAAGVSVTTPVLRLAAAVHYAPAHRRRAQAGHDARGPADHAVRARMERVRLRL